MSQRSRNNHAIFYGKPATPAPATVWKPNVAPQQVGPKSTGVAMNTPTSPSRPITQMKPPQPTTQIALNALKSTSAAHVFLPYDLCAFTVTPDIAEAWLRRSNDKNRVLSNKDIEAYAAKMKSSGWKPTASMIQLSSEGQVIDGHHRLGACVLHGISFDTVLQTGVDKETFMVIDQGRVRSAADLLTIAGEAEGVVDKKYSAVLTLILDYYAGRPVGMGSPSKTDLVKLSQQIGDSARWASKESASYRGTITPSLAGMLLYLGARVANKPAETFKFLEKLTQGVDLKTDNSHYAVYVIRRRIEEAAKRHIYERKRTRFMAASVIWALFNELQGLPQRRVCETYPLPDFSTL